MFLPSQIEKSIQFFRVQVRQKYQVFRVQSDKNAKSSFRSNRFLFVDMLFFQIRQKKQFFSSLSSNSQPWFKVSG